MNNFHVFMLTPASFNYQGAIVNVPSLGARLHICGVVITDEQYATVKDRYRTAEAMLSETLNRTLLFRESLGMIYEVTNLTYTLLCELFGQEHIDDVWQRLREERHEVQLTKFTINWAREWWDTDANREMAIHRLSLPYNPEENAFSSFSERK